LSSNNSLFTLHEPMIGKPKDSSFDTDDPKTCSAG
jgi:hypothetical protein